ncbi:hypothetical protein CBF23_002215 [Marinomonas agarivorans]|nr:hypothetical protein CBF23_002215 [Marinomonas agarivorans]
MDIFFLDFSLATIILLVFVAFVAGIIDAIAGGGGLITVPVLLLSGMEPAQALATNKLQGCAGTLSASYHFIKRKVVNLKALLPAIITTAVGSAVGTLLVSYLDRSLLFKIIPVILIAVALFFLFIHRIQPYISSKVQLGQLGFALLIGTSVGFYDGLIGPGTGSFFTTAYLCLTGATLINATANTKILNATSNVASLFIFSFTGHVLWGIGLAMAVGQWLGAQLGARLVVSKGNVLIRPLVILMCLLISSKLIYENWL